jgi:hypothetical protein
MSNGKGAVRESFVPPELLVFEVVHVEARRNCAPPVVGFRLYGLIALDMGLLVRGGSVRHPRPRRIAARRKLRREGLIKETYTALNIDAPIMACTKLENTNDEVCPLRSAASETG